MTMHRARRWNDDTWAALERLAMDSAVWRKPATHPELFGLTSRGVALADYLMRRGIRVTPGSRGEGEVWLHMDGRAITADLVRVI